MPSAESDHELAPFAARAVLAIALATVAVLLALAARDGYHRDELYFLEASRHLALGYVDQPPLSVLGAWLSRNLFGAGSLVGLRAIPALLDGAAVILTGLIARELGGSRLAQLFAALCAAVSGFLIIGHLAGPTAYDLVGWLATSLLVIRILRTGQERLWLACGLLVGVSLEGKDTILLLCFGVGIGLFVNRQARVLGSPYLWAGAAIALALWAPNLIWDAVKDWPTAEMDRSLRAEHSSLGAAAAFPGIQILLPNILLLPVWIAGWWALIREQRFRRYRSFALAYVVQFVLLLIVIPDRPYYLAPLYGVLFAAGAIRVDETVCGSRRLLRAGISERRLLWRSPRVAVIYALVAGIVIAPIALPVLPPSALATVALQKVNYNLGETIGWQSFTQTVARVYRSLAPDERRQAVLLTANYGEAGALDRYGAGLGLPPAFSGHNSYWWWGPPHADRATTIAVGYDRGDLLRYWSRVTLAARNHNRWGVSNDEEDTPIWVCRQQREPWRTIWPRLKHYG
jgi:4-amino-4-deoxy-L-arabinose transferase-like glycosyltransferase